MARWLNIVRTNFPPNYLTVWHFHISRIQKFYCTVCQQFWKMSLYSPSITYRHHIKGYNKAYHLRNKTKRKWNGDRGRGRERERREGQRWRQGGREKQQQKTPLIQDSTNVLDHGTLFSDDTINTCRILAFFTTEFGKYCTCCKKMDRGLKKERI